MERRRGVRFEIQLACRFKRHGAYEIIEATTRNLGRMGALVETGRSTYTDPQIVPQPGDLVQIEVVLPAHRNFEQRCLSCDAIAVRTATANGGLRLALQFERVEIRKLTFQPAAAGRMGVM
jgi:hypothetical protein